MTEKVNFTVTETVSQNADCPECGHTENNHDVIVDVRGTKEPVIAMQTVVCEKCNHSYNLSDANIEKTYA